MGEEQGRPMTFFGNLMRIVAAPSLEWKRSAKTSLESTPAVWLHSEKAWTGFNRKPVQAEAARWDNSPAGRAGTVGKPRIWHRLQLQLLQEFRVQLFG